MALLHEAVEFKKLDSRVIERNIERGLVSPKEVEKAIRDLPDDADNAEWVNLEALDALDDPDERSH